MKADFSAGLKILRKVLIGVLVLFSLGFAGFVYIKITDPLVFNESWCQHAH